MLTYYLVYSSILPGINNQQSAGAAVVVVVVVVVVVCCFLFLFPEIPTVFCFCYFYFRSCAFLGTKMIIGDKNDVIVCK